MSFFFKSPSKKETAQRSPIQTPALFAGTALLAFVALAGWQQGPWSTAVVAHGILAVGALPLILATMLYFTPVLTRSSSPPGVLQALPLLALVAGGMALLAVDHHPSLLVVAAPLALLVTISLFGWMLRRAHRALGAPHPGLLWYQAALLSLLLGLAAILATRWWPEQWATLRTLHRHLNLLGFVGLTALGTLQVLLPTVGQYADPMASWRLRVDLKYALLGVVCMVSGAVFANPWLSGLGLLAWGWVAGRLLRPVGREWKRMVRMGGAELSLLGALLGFLLALSSGLWQKGELFLPLFFALFLLPLVSGALAHLLPLWWWPGQPTPQRTAAQQILGSYALLRLGGFWLGGGAILLGYAWGNYCVIVPVLALLGQVGWLRGKRGA
ncbi:MAG: hypothetical protein HQL88_01980 [Magnetococcales bacterium]|nr:hypothetical protein [Magnetococcales bacterium]